MTILDHILDYFTTTDEKLKAVIKRLDDIKSLLSGIPSGGGGGGGEINVTLPQNYTTPDNFIFRENVVVVPDGEEDTIISFDVHKNSVFYLQQIIQSNTTTDMVYTLLMDNKEISLADDVFGTVDRPFDLTSNGYKKGIQIKTNFKLKAKNTTGAPVSISARIIGELEYTGE